MIPIILFKLTSNTLVSLIYLDFILEYTHHFSIEVVTVILLGQTYNIYVSLMYVFFKTPCSHITYKTAATQVPLTSTKNIKVLESALKCNMRTNLAAHSHLCKTSISTLLCSFRSTEMLMCVKLRIQHYGKVFTNMKTESVTAQFNKSYHQSQQFQFINLQLFLEVFLKSLHNPLSAGHFQPREL